MPRITLEAARVNSHMTQEEAARALGVSAKTVWNWEHGVGIDSITWKQLEKIESVYGISRDYIFLSSDTGLTDIKE